MGKLTSVLANFGKVVADITEAKENSSDKVKKLTYGADGFFKPATVKGTKETSFIIRFLPIPDTSCGTPWVSLTYHMFNRDGDKRYTKILNCQEYDKDMRSPILDRCKELYATGNAIDKNKADAMWKRKRYFSLVYVKDAPENQKEFIGKVLIFEMGDKLLDKLNITMTKKKKCFYDPNTGDDFLLVLVENPKNPKWYDYSRSEFMGSPGKISDDEKVIKSIEEQLDNFPSIREAVLKKEGKKTYEQIKDIIDGGLLKEYVEPSDNKLISEKSHASDNIKEDTTLSDIDFGDVSSDKPKDEVKPAAKVEAKPVSKPTDSPEEVGGEIDDFNVSFDDVNLDEEIK